MCDDDNLCRQQAVNAIENVTKSLDVLVDAFDNGYELLKRFNTVKYDLIMLDIEMPTIDGITLAKKIRDLSENVYIVFLTSHIEFALEGYEVNALRYLTKPINLIKLKEILDYISLKQGKEEVLWIKTEDTEEKIKLSDIFYFEAQNQNVIINCGSKEYVTRYNLKEFEKELVNKNFIRVHRGYLVSLEKITKLGKGCVYLETDICIPVSRSKEKELKSAILSFAYKEAL
ncbi:MAG: LytTR family DNA-binding domain-containing protein [Ruminococcus sp.]|nr:LytTR family DNA-binding domain-containing protein [Ruminococcus sp.]